MISKDYDLLGHDLFRIMIKVIHGFYLPIQLGQNR